MPCMRGLVRLVSLNNSFFKLPLQYCKSEKCSDTLHVKYTNILGMLWSVISKVQTVAMYNSLLLGTRF